MSFKLGLFGLKYMVMLLLLTVSLSRCYAPIPMAHSGVVTPPYWAPSYDNVSVIHYYYLPDIECYYDVWNREFIYLYEGNWLFVSQLPYWYAWYDFNTSYVVLLNYRVNQPWMHHHRYLSHYPRYYYHNTTQNNTRNPRSFNENRNRKDDNKIAQEEPYQATPNSVSPRLQTQPQQEAISKDQKVPQTRPPQVIQYRSKQVGQPVRVEPKMKYPRATPTPKLLPRR